MPRGLVSFSGILPQGIASDPIGNSLDTPLRDNRTQDICDTIWGYSISLVSGGSSIRALESNTTCRCGAHAM